MFQSNKKDQISLVTRQYLVGRLMMKYQNRGSFCFYFSCDSKYQNEEAFGSILSKRFLIGGSTIKDIFN